MLSFTLALTLVASVACGVLPAWYARRVNLIEAVSEDGMKTIGGTRSSTVRARGLIMVGQVAIACALLISASLLTRSLVALIRADRGYDPSNVLTARLPFPAGYSAARRGEILDSLVDRLRSMPGVTQAAYGTALPLLDPGGITALTMRSPRDPSVEMQAQAIQRVVSPEYFAALRLRLVEGRALLESDTATTRPAVVVNRTFARQYLGDRALGVRLPQYGPRAGAFLLADTESDWEVVGIVDDIRQEGVEAPLQPEIFVSFQQMAADTLQSVEPILVIRTATDPVSYVSTMQALVREQAPDAALESVMTMEDRVATSLARPRLYTIVLVAFALVAVTIATVGLFGVLSFSVARRMRELGVRSALGAQPGDIIALVLRQMVWIVALGEAIGVGAALAAGRALSMFLYGVTPYDAPTFVAVPILITVMAAAACFIPARRAAGMDALKTLRAG
jgi:putative ABC transport system permease protein